MVYFLKIIVLSLSSWGAIAACGPDLEVGTGSLLTDAQIRESVERLKEIVQANRYRLTPNEVDSAAAELNLNKEQFYFVASVFAAQKGLQPISNFKVGTAGVTEDGYLILGSNIEFANSSLGQTIHAERTVMFLVHEAGKKLARLYSSVTPCGVCRQWLNEIANAETLPITSRDLGGKLYTVTLRDLLPSDFSPRHLGQSGMLDGQLERWRVSEVDRKKLPEELVKAVERSYAPYSRAPQGAFIELKDGRRFTGSSIEEVSYEMHPALAIAFAKMTVRGIKSEEIRNVTVALAPTNIANHRASNESIAFSATLGLTPEQVKFIELEPVSEVAKSP